MKAAGVELEPIDPERVHVPLSEIDVGDRFTISFQREPLSWWHSEWKFRRTVVPAEYLTHPYDHLLHLPFEEFLSHVQRDHADYLQHLYRTLLEPGVDFLGRYENLADDLCTALRLAGQSFDEEALRSYPAINVSQAA